MTVICPKCQKEMKHQGALNLHLLHCDRMLNKKNTETKKDGVEVTSYECNHTFRLLNPRDMVENHAFSEGYKEVCDKCLDLR